MVSAKPWKKRYETVQTSTTENCDKYQNYFFGENVRRNKIYYFKKDPLQLKK